MPANRRRTARIPKTMAAIAGALACSLSAAAPVPAVAAPQCNSNPADGVDWSGCRKRNLILDGSDLKGAHLSETDFTSTDLRNSELDGADFGKSTLVRSMVDNSKATRANFEKAVGFRTSFVKSDLSDATFTKSEMQRADFTSANLTNVNFEKSELGRAVFADAKIDGAVFRFANLARADFRGSRFSGPLDFQGAYFYRTRIDGVDLSQAVGMAQWQIDLACGDDKTKLPRLVHVPIGWPCGEE